jgi:hypothetical protein
MIDDESTVTVTMTLSVGSAILTASKARYDPYESLPTLTNFTWTSLQNSNRNELEIKPSDSEFCLYCMIVVGVFTQDAASSYSISMTYNFTQLMLENGVPHRDYHRRVVAVLLLQRP